MKIVKQIHSNIVCTIDDASFDSSEVEADALVTRLTNVALGVNTADCVPVLFADNVNKVIGIAHAGWKGALNNILQNTVKAMQAIGADISSLSALIGPCIHKESYEVGDDLYNKFLDQNQENKKYFEALYMPNKYLFDLRAYVRDKLAESSIEAVLDMHHNTFAMPSLYSSYRRSSLGSQSYQGSLLSTIILR
ncbi:MAG: yfiH [Rickettsiaceae bacterium]|nr:yfiH [Rickettsiaceae bacterium]